MSTVTAPERRHTGETSNATTHELLRGMNRALNAAAGVPSPEIIAPRATTEDEIWQITLGGLEDATYHVLLHCTDVRPPIVAQWLTEHDTRRREHTCLLETRASEERSRFEREAAARERAHRRHRGNPGPWSVFKRMFKE